MNRYTYDKDELSREFMRIRRFHAKRNAQRRLEHAKWQIAIWTLFLSPLWIAAFYIAAVAAAHKH